MPIQVNQSEKARNMAPAVILAVLVGLGIIIATNWRALILVIVVLSSAAGYWLAK